MTDEDHIRRHRELHNCLDELIADWFKHVPGSGTDAPVIALMSWSHRQTIEPDHQE